MSEQLKSAELYDQTRHKGVRRSLARHGLDNLIDDNDNHASYEGGWGFFEDDSFTPPEFQVTRDDDYLIDTILNEQSRPALDRGPLSPERQAIAQEGVKRLFEAAWGFDRGTLEDVREARLRLYQLDRPERAIKKKELYQQGKYIRYQGGPLEDNRYDAFINGSGSDFLHFGVAETANSTPASDRLDSFMRVYIYTRPEYAGHVAAEIVRRMRNNYGKEVYGKISDTSTDADPNALQREDNLLLYMKTHSEMVAAAKILKELTSERPQVFNENAGKLDRARKTDIPFVSIAEEPIQVEGGIQESFNSSRENIESEAQNLLVKTFSTRYPETACANINEVFQYAYKSDLKSKQELKSMYRKAVQYIAPKYHVSQRNYALNEVDDRII